MFHDGTDALKVKQLIATGSDALSPEIIKALLEAKRLEQATGKAVAEGSSDRRVHSRGGKWYVVIPSRTEFWCARHRNAHLSCFLKRLFQ
jgi:hypothetical protein